MTIDEAITLQAELLNLLPEVGFDKYKASTKLGIEALEVVIKAREGDYASFKLPLPGET